MTSTKNALRPKNGGQNPGQGKEVEIETVHIDALMNIVHQLTSAGSERPTNNLDVRQRLVVQYLGLEGSHPIVVVGSKLGLSASTMTRIIDRLEALKIVARQNHPTDRRVTVLALTKTGMDIFDQERAFYGSLLEATVSGLDESSTSDVLNALAALGSLTGMK